MSRVEPRQERDEGARRGGAHFDSQSSSRFRIYLRSSSGVRGLIAFSAALGGRLGGGCACALRAPPAAPVPCAVTRARIDSPRSSPHRCRVAPVVRCALWAAAARRIYRIRFLFESSCARGEAKNVESDRRKAERHWKTLSSIRLFDPLWSLTHTTESSQSGILSSRLYMYLRVRPLFSSLSGWAADVSASSLLRLAWKPCVREAARPSRARARLQCKQLPELTKSSRIRGRRVHRHSHSSPG